MEKHINNLIKVFLTVYFGYAAIFVVTKPMNPTYWECGTVVSKSGDEIIIKHGLKTELYLNVEFFKSGFKSILVKPETYFKHKKGEMVCFDLPKEKPLWYTILQLSGIGFYLFIIFSILWKIAEFIVGDTFD